MMTASAIAILICICACASFIRLQRGPTIADRIVAANAIGIMLFSLILLLGYKDGSPAILDVALVYAVLQFADVLIMAKYLGLKETESTDA